MPQIYVNSLPRATPSEPVTVPRRPPSPPPIIYEDDDDDDTDSADSSIVLSDLVRTGEASRLRRRGAMRIDPHHIVSLTASTPPSVTTTRIVGGGLSQRGMVLVSDPWTDQEEEEEEEDVEMRTWHARRVTGNVVGRMRNPAGELDYSYTIFCGGSSSADDVLEQDTEPYEPSPLPLFPPPSPKKTKHSHASKRNSNSNACGALLHLSAAVKCRPASSSTSFTWTAPAPSSQPPVVPIDSSYLSPRDIARVKAHLSPCGCTRQPIACAACGNMVGLRARFCGRGGHISSSSLAPPQRREQVEGPRGPEGRAYWRPTSLNRNPQSQWVYTFFPDTVESHPKYTPSTSTPTPAAPRPRMRVPSAYPYITPRLPSSHPHPQPQAQPPSSSDTASSSDTIVASDPDMPRLYEVSDSDSDSSSSPARPARIFRARQTASNGPMLDRLITASPTPLSDEEREAYQARTPPAAPRYSYGYPMPARGYHGGSGTYSGYTGYPSSSSQSMGGGYHSSSYGSASEYFGAFREYGGMNADGEIEEPGSPDKALGEGPAEAFFFAQR